MTKKTVWRNPDGAEREYTRIMLALHRSLVADTNKYILPALATLSEQRQNEMNQDSWLDDWQQRIKELEAVAKMHVEKAKDKLPMIFKSISDKNQKEFERIVKLKTGITLPPVMDGVPKYKLGINPFRSEPFLIPLREQWIKTNTDLIVTYPTKFYADIVGDVERGFSNGWSVKQLKQQLQKRYEMSDYRATLIAQDQILKANADLTEQRLKSAGVEKYIWRTSNDSRVRPEHAARNGKTFRFDNPPPDGNAGKPIRCRCYAEPIFDEYGEL